MPMLFLEYLPKAKMLNINPAMIGNITISKISSIIFQKFNSTNCPPNNCISRGVSKGDNKVATAVMVIESARLAFAINDITLDANPLGETPIKTTPAAISGGKLKVFAIVIPKKGIILN